MNKVANRSIRRVLQILGKMADNGASSGELRTVLRSGTKRKTHRDLSKPIWERHGYDSKDELLQSWRDSKAQALKEFPEPVLVQPGFGQRISDFIYRVRYGHRRLRPITEFTSPAEHIRQAYRYPVRTNNRGTYIGSRKLADTSADYTPIINAYLGRVAANYKGRGAYGRFRDLMHRHDVLSGNGGSYIQPAYSRDGGYKKLPDAYEVRTTFGGSNRLLDKLGDSMLRATGSKRFPDEFFDVFPFVSSSSGVSTFQMPVVTVFNAKGPFATTGHIQSGPITRRYNEQVHAAINKLNESSIPITHRNIKNTLAEAGVDNTRTTLHSGRTYPDKMAKNYAHVFDADAKPTKDYESVFKVGDPNAPVPVQDYIVEMLGDAGIRQAEVIKRSGNGHILKRPTESLLNTQGTSDLMLFKGSQHPVHATLNSNPGDPLIDSILENTLDPDYLRELRRRNKDIFYDLTRPNSLNTLRGTKGAKYADGTDIWYTPKLGSAAGYAVHGHGLNISPEAAEGIRLIPVTSAELDALHHVYDVNDILSKLPPSVLNDFKYLAASHGGNRYATRLAKRTERNVSQLRAAIKDLAEGKGINNGIGKAITRNSKFREAGINTRSKYDDAMFKEVLGDNW